MTTFEKGGSQQKRYGLFVFAVLLLASATAAFFVGFHNSMIRSLSVLAMMASAYLVLASHVHTRTDSSVASVQELGFKGAQGPGRSAWGISVVMVPVAVVSFLFLQSDAAHGGHKVWPAYVFAGVAVVCAVVWGYLVSELMSQRR